MVHDHGEVGAAEPHNLGNPDAAKPVHGRPARKPFGSGRIVPGNRDSDGLDARFYKAGFRPTTRRKPSCIPVEPCKLSIKGALNGKAV